MFESMAVYFIFMNLGLFLILIPILLIFIRKRRVALEKTLLVCDPQKVKLKSFIANKAKGQSFIKRIIIEAVFSFKPYVDGFLVKEFKDGLIERSHFHQYMALNNKVKNLVMILFIILLLLSFTLIVLGVTGT